MSTKRRSWADIPEDILSSIMHKISSKLDRCNFRTVCKPWRSCRTIPSQQKPLDPSIFCHITPSVKDSLKFPTLAYIRGDSSVINFFNYMLDWSSLVIPEIADAKIFYSKYGWLLMSDGIIRDDEKVHFFFFNPFTKQRIDLPGLIDCYSLYNASFSSLPTSSDCVVLVISQFRIKLEFLVFNSIRRGDRRWKWRRLCTKVEFPLANCSPIYCKGAFYIMSETGKLVTYNPGNDSMAEEFQVLDESKPCISIKNCYMVESEDRILSVFVGHAGRWVKVFQFDDSSKTWHCLNSLGDKMLFLSSTTSVTIRAIKEETLGMENKIYFPRFIGKDGVFYSWTTHKFHTFENGYTCGNYDGTKEYIYCSWFEPNFHIYTDEELDWLHVENLGY